MKRLLLTVALLIAVPASRGHAEDLGPASFAFVKPGKTSIADAEKRLGKAWSRYKSKTVAGEVDLFVKAQDFNELKAVRKRATSRRAKVVDVEVLEYDLPDEDMDGNAKLVFRDGLLEYAVLPVSASETTREKLVSRYGKDPRVSERERAMGDVIFSAIVFAYPEEGLAFVKRGDSDEIDRKVIFVPVAK